MVFLIGWITAPFFTAMAGLMLALCTLVVFQSLPIGRRRLASYTDCDVKGKGSEACTARKPEGGGSCKL